MKKEVLLILLVFTISTVSALHNVSTDYNEKYFEVNENITRTYKLKIENSDIGQDPNITKVEIILPNGFTFIKDSQDTTAEYKTFTNTSNELEWTGTNLVNSSEYKYFQFDAIAMTPGNHTLEIKTSNKTDTILSEISITVYEVLCETEWSCESWSDCINDQQTRICTDLKECMENRTEIKNCSECIPTWNCTDWSKCVNGEQIRSCVDFNLCANDTTKPEETKSCSSDNCQADWECDKWQPEECETDETQQRTCTDYNYCGILEGKPSESRTCPGRDFANFFGPIVIFIIILIIGAGIALYEIIRRKKAKEKSPPQENPTNNTSFSPPSRRVNFRR